MNFHMYLCKCIYVLVKNMYVCMYVYVCIILVTYELLFTIHTLYMLRYIHILRRESTHLPRLDSRTRFWAVGSWASWGCSSVCPAANPWASTCQPPPIHYLWRGNGYCDVCMYVCRMNHEDHGFCVGFMVACLAIPFGLSMENNDSRLLCIPKEEFQRVNGKNSHIHTKLKNCISLTYVNT